MRLSKTIQAYMKAYMELWPFSGTVCVIKNEQIVFEQAYGKACIEFDVPNRTDTRFSLASVSKQFTCFAAMQLHEKGHLHLDAPINDYLPDELKTDSRITAHHLMSHTSGLTTIHGLQDDFFGDKDKLNYNREAFVSRFLRCPLQFDPGSAFEYCNTGYSMLAYLIETVSGLSLKNYLSEHIFTPLGMHNTELEEGNDILLNKAYGYCMNKENTVRAEYHNPAYSIGAGGMVSNSSDLYKWYLCLKNRSLLGPAAYSRFLNENRNGYCYGLFKDSFDGKTRYQHDGAYLGFGAYMQNFLDDDVCVLVLCNYDFVNYFRIGDAISRVIFTGKAVVPKKPAEIVLDEQLARQYEGVYVKERAELKKAGHSWEFIHLNRFHKPLYPIGNHQFHSTWLDKTYTLQEDGDDGFKFLGLNKQK